jgi:hypothetical protein
MTEEQINHKLRHVYGCRTEDINDPSREPEAALLAHLERGPCWLTHIFFAPRQNVARFRLILSGQIEQDPHGWRISKTCEKTAACDTMSAETGLTEPKE